MGRVDRAEVGNRRSNYGLKTYTPEETKNQWKETVKRQVEIHRNHNCAANERRRIEKIKNGEYVPTSYFNNNKQHKTPSAYDRQFHMEEGCYSRLKRDDRMASLGLDINAEESNKCVPILSSSSYGHRVPLEKPARKNCRVALVQRDFYRDSGTNIPSNDQ
ncbi:cilia- and flagella-associated protein 90-like isoform X2 [Clytia hemisphaerica]|uniref:Uncharacterized protein n=1 Tax=Clytia hemisphaerica TaxID=252671 RepID=A0A7M5WT83_9CNID